MQTRRMSIASPPRSLLVPRIVAVAFVTSIAALGIASWDIARGRVPDTASPLVLQLLETPENRRCSRDAAAELGKFLPVGMPKAAVIALLQNAQVGQPQPWFWRPMAEDALTEAADTISFTRVIRYTAFGNQKVAGEIGFDNQMLKSVAGRVVCAFG